MWLLLEILLGLIIVCLFIPKGNTVHELTRLPFYWLKTFTTQTKFLTAEKHDFGQHKLQYLLHIPPQPDLPERDFVIVYYHGGGWRYGKPELFKANAKVFADQGYHVFMPSYRRTPQYNYNDIREDLEAAMTTISKVMLHQNILDKKIVLGGLSAGGHLVSLILYDRAFHEKIAWSQDQFGGIFVCGTPLNLAMMRDSLLLRQFAGKRDEDSFRQANPIEHMQSNENLPLLFIHGTKDGMVEYEASISFIEKLEQINPPIVTKMVLPKGTHLDSGRWVYRNDEVRKTILTWLETSCKEHNNNKQI